MNANVAGEDTDELEGEIMATAREMFGADVLLQIETLAPPSTDTRVALVLPKLGEIAAFHSSARWSALCVLQKRLEKGFRSGELHPEVRFPPLPYVETGDGCDQCGIEGPVVVCGERLTIGEGDDAMTHPESSMARLCRGCLEEGLALLADRGF